MAVRREKKRVNLRDVARAADVSVATVSRVLNAPQVVQQGTRDRVLQAIDTLGFHPSAAARAINSGRTRILGALIPTLDNAIFASTIEAIEKRLGDFGYSLVVATTSGDPGQELRRARELLDIGVEGFFLSGITHDDALVALLENRDVPIIAISHFDPCYRYPTVGYDNRQAAQKALEHLVAQGHRSIAVLHGSPDFDDRTRARLDGTRTDAPDVRLHYTQATELSASGGTDAAIEVLDIGRPIDAFLCLSDILAIGVLFELQLRDNKVPRQVAVMGIHDLPIAASVAPRLSTVRLPARQMGSHAAEALAFWLDEDIRPEPKCFETTLIQRETT